MESFTAAAREGIASTGQPTPSQESAPSSSASHATAAPLLKPENVSDARQEGIISSNAPRRVALNKHAMALLHDVAFHPLTLTTPSFVRCKLRLSEGERAKTTVTNLGFLESFKVRTGAGRGKTGQAMRLTPSGWSYLDRKPPKSTRGGDSVFHEFCVQHLSRLIPHSTIETLGADLVLPYNAADHGQLITALETLSEQTITLDNGDLLALEVECSMPERTAPRNITRDAGFALTIIAILGKNKLTATFGNRVVIVDVLRLLDALRTTEDR